MTAVGGSRAPSSDTRIRSARSEDFTRYGFGLSLLMVCGLYKVDGWTPASATPMTVGVLMGLGFTLGWAVLPGSLARRLSAAAIGFVGFFSYHWILPPLARLLPSVAVPAVGAVVFAGLLAAWLIVRNRPLLCYLLLVVPAVAAVVGSSAGGELAGFYGPLVGLFAGAWAAHFIARSAPASRFRPSSAQDQQVPVVNHDGVDVPLPGTNAFSIVSLVLSLVGLSALGVVFGHIALAQVHRTKQGGRELAIAGLIVGYVGLLSLLIVAAWYLTILAAFISR